MASGFGLRGSFDLYRCTASGFGLRGRLTRRFRQGGRPTSRIGLGRGLPFGLGFRRRPTSRFGLRERLTRGVGLRRLTGRFRLHRGLPLGLGACRTFTRRFGLRGGPALAVGFRRRAKSRCGLRDGLTLGLGLGLGLDVRRRPARGRRLRDGRPGRRRPLGLSPLRVRGRPFERLPLGLAFGGLPSGFPVRLSSPGLPFDSPSFGSLLLLQPPGRPPAAP